MIAKTMAASAVSAAAKRESDISGKPYLLGEVRFGILRLAKGRRRTRLQQWFNAGVRRLR
jgi:hypothetical protein